MVFPLDQTGFAPLASGSVRFVSLSLSSEATGPPPGGPPLSSAPAAGGSGHAHGSCSRTSLALLLPEVERPELFTPLKVPGCFLPQRVPGSRRGNVTASHEPITDGGRR